MCFAVCSQSGAGSVRGGHELPGLHARGGRHVAAGDVGGLHGLRLLRLPREPLRHRASLRHLVSVVDAVSVVDTVRLVDAVSVVDTVSLCQSC